MTRDEAQASMRDWRRRKEALDGERDRLILRAWLAGMEVTQVAAMMGISRPTVYKSLGDNQGAFAGPDRCEVERLDGDEGTTFRVRAWRGRVEASTGGMSRGDAVAFLAGELGVNGDAAEDALYNACQSARPCRVF